MARDVDTMKLDMGCGTNKVPGAIGVDRNRDTSADVICDVERTIPFRDDSFAEIHCRQLVEHVDDLVALMEEIHRVGRKGAKVIVEAPFYASMGAYSDPTHRRFITEHTFDYFTGSTCSFYTRSRFRICRMRFRYGIVPRVLFFIPKLLFRRFLFNSTHGISFELEVVKE
jgi:ubiquinone/menaquinone biosynthesis C-methylase UbiE